MSDSTKTFGTPETMQQSILDELAIQIKESDLGPFQKLRLRAALKRPRVRNKMMDEIIATGHTEGFIQTSEMSDDGVVTFQIDWEALINLLIKLLPLLLMFL